MYQRTSTFYVQHAMSNVFRNTKWILTLGKHIAILLAHRPGCFPHGMFLQHHELIVQLQQGFVRLSSLETTTCSNIANVVGSATDYLHHQISKHTHKQTHTQCLCTPNLNINLNSTQHGHTSIKVCLTSSFFNLLFSVNNMSSIVGLGFARSRRSSFARVAI